MSTQNKIVTEKDLRDKWVLLYFGYSFSPDVGPEQLKMISRAVDKLGLLSLIHRFSHRMWSFTKHVLFWLKQSLIMTRRFCRSLSLLTLYETHLLISTPTWKVRAPVYFINSQGLHCCCLWPFFCLQNLMIEYLDWPDRQVQWGKWHKSIVFILRRFKKMETITSLILLTTCKETFIRVPKSKILFVHKKERELKMFIFGIV